MLFSEVDMDIAAVARYESVGYFVEVLIAELLFLLPLKKRSFFVPRLIISALVLAAVISRLSLGESYDPVIRFIFLLVIIALSYLCMVISFKGDAFLIASSCIAGVATQHIANKTIAILMLIPG